MCFEIRYLIRAHSVSLAVIFKVDATNFMADSTENILCAVWFSQKSWHSINLFPVPEIISVKLSPCPSLVKRLGGSLIVSSKQMSFEIFRTAGLELFTN